MYRLPLKPLSLNAGYRGRRFTTPTLKKYKQDIYRLAPKIKIPEGKLEAHYLFALSSKNSDLDNCIKMLQDGLAGRYGFNDKKIYKLVVEKIDVKKGLEFVEFEINKYETM